MGGGHGFSPSARDAGSSVPLRGSPGPSHLLSAIALPRGKTMLRLSLMGACIALGAAFLCLVPQSALGAHMVVSGKADGTRVYIGFMHSKKLVYGAKLAPGLYGSHGANPIPVGKHKYHMVVTVFDTASGNRVTDAKLKARIALLAFGAAFVDLPGTKVAGKAGYCGFFDMPPHDLYVIELRIKRPDRAGEIKMRFEHEPPD